MPGQGMISGVWNGMAGAKDDHKKISMQTWRQSQERGQRRGEGRLFLPDWPSTGESRLIGPASSPVFSCRFLSELIFFSSPTPFSSCFSPPVCLRLLVHGTSSFDLTHAAQKKQLEKQKEKKKGFLSVISLCPQKNPSSINKAAHPSNVEHRAMLQPLSFFSFLSRPD